MSSGTSIERPADGAGSGAADFQPWQFFTLAALIGDVGAETATERGRNPRRVPIELLRPNPRNPRRNFSDGELDELARSIEEHGVIQPIVVRPVRGARDSYEIIAGERRWRAAQRAGLHEIPIVSLEATDSEALELAIIENVQRTDLNPLEEAGGYQALAGEYQHSHEHIARIVGKSRSHVSNTLRLLKLPERVKDYIIAGEISAGAARMLVGASDPEQLARGRLRFDAGGYRLTLIRGVDMFPHTGHVEAVATFTSLRARSS